MADILGLQSMFQQAGQGFGSGVQSLADSLTQRKKQQQQQQQLNIDQERADSEKAFQQGQLDNEDTKQNFEARKYRDAAPARALEAEGKKTDIENAKAEEARKQKTFDENKRAKDIEEHVAAGLGPNGEVPETPAPTSAAGVFAGLNAAGGQRGGASTTTADGVLPKTEAQKNVDATGNAFDKAKAERNAIVKSAIEKLGPDVDVEEVLAEVKKQQRQIKENGLSDAQKRAATYETNARGNLANAQANNVGAKAGAAAADQLTAGDDMLDRLDRMITRAQGQNISFGPRGKVAEQLPTGAQSTDRQEQDQDAAFLKSGIPLLIAQSKRVPGGPEMKLLDKGLPSLDSTVSQADYVKRLQDLRNEAAAHVAHVRSHAGGGAPAAAQPTSVASALLGPSPHAPPAPGAQVIAPDQPASSVFKKRLDRRGH